MSVLRHRPLGERIPNLPHSVSCSLPTLADVIGYEERKPSVIDRMTSGYPRFVKHPYLRQVAAHVVTELGANDSIFWPCSSQRAAEALLAWMPPYPSRLASLRGVHGVLVPNTDAAFRHGKTFLQHTGYFLSSREAEDFLVRESIFADVQPEVSGTASAQDLRRQLAKHSGAGEDNLFLCNSGMNAVYAAFRALDEAQRKRGRTVWIQLGWLYLDTIAILQKFTSDPKRDYLLHGDVFDLAGLRELIRANAGRVAGVITEVPTNPLVQTCDLAAVAELCRQEGAALIADPSVNCMANVNVLPHCDALVTSLTKYFGAEGDVIAGLVAVNRDGPFAHALRTGLPAYVESPYKRDELRLAAQSANVDSVVAKINATLPAVAECLLGLPAIDEVFWALHPRSREGYLKLARTPESVGSMITFTVKKPLAEIYDRLLIAKGPSFGMHTSLACPFMYLAHYDLVTSQEGRAHLRGNGLNPELIRMSIGTEPTGDLIEALREALS